MLKTKETIIEKYKSQILKFQSPQIAVIGWPIHHSLSPIIHQYWLKKYNLKGSYQALGVAPEEKDIFFENIAKTGLKGANVTLPYKEKALEIAQQASVTAKAIGASNTLIIQNENVLAENTDSFGFLANLDQAYAHWDQKKDHACIIGAGGASRAIIFALLKRHYKKISVVNRTLEKAEKLCNLFGDRCEAVSFDQLEKIIQKTDLIVNTTSLGMVGEKALEIDLKNVPSSTIVTDIVYTPLETPLLHQAKNRGLITIDGIGMLLHQARPSFEKWFGILPEVDKELRNIILTKLNEKL